MNSNFEQLLVAISLRLEELVTEHTDKLNELVIINTKILDSIQMITKDQSLPHQREARLIKLMQEIISEVQRP